MTTQKVSHTDKRQLHFLSAVDAHKVTKALFAESQLYKTNVYVLETSYGSVYVDIKEDSLS